MDVLEKYAAKKVLIEKLASVPRFVRALLGGATRASKAIPIGGTVPAADRAALQSLERIMAKSPSIRDKVMGLEVGQNVRRSLKGPGSGWGQTSGEAWVKPGVDQLALGRFGKKPTGFQREMSGLDRLYRVDTRNPGQLGALTGGAQIAKRPYGMKGDMIYGKGSPFKSGHTEDLALRGRQAWDRTGKNSGKYTSPVRPLAEITRRGDPARIYDPTKVQRVAEAFGTPGPLGGRPRPIGPGKSWAGSYKKFPKDYRQLATQIGHARAGRSASAFAPQPGVSLQHRLKRFKNLNILRDPEAWKGLV